MFIDKVKVSLIAGNGGDGVTSFRHEKFRKLGGPDGGDGGNGGDVILRASRNQNTLAAFRYKKLLKAQSGANGQKAKKRGKSGEDLVAEIPVGTVVLSEAGGQLADFTADGQVETLAKGGRGGFGNAHFVSSTRQAPRVAEKGEKGETTEATLELKMIADVGLVGLPNAGKSTLLSVVSNAKPEIANYPFTTLVPNLGVVDIDKEHSLLFADIPGLIEGASQGKGLGDEFLRHIERTSVLVHLIDAYSGDVESGYKTIIKELHDYTIDLSKKPQIVALSKIEGLDQKTLKPKIEKLKKIVPSGTPLTKFSSLSREDLPQLLRLILKEVEKTKKQQVKKAEKKAIPVIGLREEEDVWEIKKTTEGFIVTGKKLERFAARTKFGDPHGEQRLRDILSKTGVIKELDRHGIEPGQKIIIGKSAIGELRY